MELYLYLEVNYFILFLFFVACMSESCVFLVLCHVHESHHVLSAYCTMVCLAPHLSLTAYSNVKIDTDVKVHVVCVRVCVSVDACVVLQ